MKLRGYAVFFVPLCVLACAEAPAGTPVSGTPSGLVITIQGFTFSPTDLQVPPGATVTVRNMDSDPHSVTSQAAPAMFTPGSVAGVSFDTGAFHGEASFVISNSAPVGTVVPYYCMVHKGMMKNQAQITVSGQNTDAGTPPTSPPPSNPPPPGYY